MCRGTCYLYCYPAYRRRRENRCDAYLALKAEDMEEVFEVKTGHERALPLNDLVTRLLLS